MVAYVVIGLIVIVAIVVIVGAIMRKKIYKQIDHIESWKIDILNRPVKDEISKVKELKMVGETEKKFETWRHDWDEIVSTELPLVEERLFDAEEMADRFRFDKASQVLSELQLTMEDIEFRLKEMLADLNVVVESDEKNRKDIVEVKEQFHSLKKILITNRPQYKKTLPFVEAKLEKIEENLTLFEKETNEGNIINARKILSETKTDIEALTETMDIIPKHYKQITKVIPGQLKELESGVKEMTDSGYVLSHLQIDEQMVAIRDKLQLFEEKMEKAEFNEVEQGLTAIFEQLEALYNLIEKEVESRHKIKEQADLLRNDLRIVGEKIDDVSSETVIVQQSYRIDQEDLREQADIDQFFGKLDEEFNEVDEILQEKREAYSILFEKITAMREQLDHLHDDVDAFKVKLNTLRKDEMVAKDLLRDLKQQLIESRRKLQRSNLPGVPTEYLTLLEEGEDVLSEISSKLDEKPLEMQTVKQLLPEAKEKIKLVLNKTDEMIESAVLTEQLIQYGNRYRSQNPMISEELNRAEAYFRSYNYTEAIEIAASAIFQVDKTVLKKFKVEIEEIS
ncbi:septation ring formation regulator [Pullulanibacillus pueri]|uniref:Septation ring formation regulator EzrA n=1 Tax=Pullulanibacillus pueri TaxID=1437324 RepID=A0A8J2ZYG1_9BACL|nr:septation ring formation regulator EzrA [Pullulanibacillus pueri]MBM7683507.1 septation ring formation regulator [Pullulanibacillus pueri]GGH86664.1 septation ring formation regulator EzrA [Pullulanibacillus pueri]